ncbi:receptor-type tyrosine-protein phosphatase F-like isoform X10 [Eriocheir sinensis]|uniref:receptor-type tyrosine-protein phosphatase F-like isoform X10 n=2 Tax=Eriocheir sinensis TaxID=95602 RepID=UPI0021C6233F|nr:receptor-type tyrosine-protein phosphatase F-like isoform X10 [Eriocheir sinensis]
MEVANGTSLLVTWDYTEGSPLDGELESFKVSWGVQGEATGRKQQTVGLLKTFLINHLQPNTSYTIKVRGKNKGVDQLGAESEITATTLGEPGKVTSLRMEEAHGTALLVTWDYPQDSPQQGELESFIVSWGVQGEAIGLKQQTVGLQKRFRILNLQPNTSYTIKVQGKNKGVDQLGAESVIIATTTLGEPGNVTNLRMEVANGTSLLVTWDYTEGSPLDGELESFKVSWGVQGEATGRKQQTVGLLKTFLINHLQPNTSYTIKVRGKNKGVDQLGAESEITATTLGEPGNVTNLRMEVANGTSLLVTWDYTEGSPLDGELESFKVSWGVQGEATGRKQQTVGLLKTFLINHLQPNTSYTIKVRGKNKGVDQLGAESEITATTLGEPGKVTSLRMEEAHGTALLVTWDYPQDSPQQGELESFIVSWGVQGEAIGLKQQTVGLQKRFRILNLQPNTSYTIKVRGKNIGVDELGAESEIIATTTLGEPGNVTNLRTEEANGTSLLVAWDYLQNSPLNGQLESFIVSWDVQGEATGRKQQTVGLHRRFLINHLQPNTTYTIKIRGKTEDVYQLGAESEIIATTLGEPGKVTSLRMEEAHGTSLLVTWDNPMDSPLNEELESFIVSWGVQGEATGWKHLTVGLQKRFLINHLQRNTSYTIKVQGKNKGVDQLGAESEITATTLGEPGKVTSLRMEEAHGTALLVTWDYPQDSPQQGELESFKVSWEVQGEATGLKQQTVGLQKRFLIMNLQPNTSYTIKVQGKNKGVDQLGAESEIIATTLGEPGKVTNLRTEEANGTSLLVTWDNPQDSPSKEELESFKVSWVVQGEATGREEQTVGLQKRFLINHLQPNTSYTIKVRGKNRGVEKFGAASKIIASTTLGVPPQVVELKNSNATVSWLTVSWPTPETNTGITSFYNVVLRPAAAAVAATDSRQWNKTVYTTQAEFDGLDVETRYRAQVQACNNESCGETVVGDVWTRPARLRLLTGKVDLGESTETTMTIRLPLLANPPGSHYVMVQRDETVVPSRKSDQDLMNTALTLVESMENNATSKNSSLDSPKMYIAAKLQQEDDKRLQVTLGDDKSYEGYYNQPFKKDAAYWTLVVTEKKSGSWTERVCSVPRRFVAAPNNTFEGLGLAAGMAAMLLVIAALAIVCIKKRQQPRVELSRDHIVNKPHVPSQPGLAVSWRAGSKAADEDNQADPPSVATLLPRVPQQKEQPDYLDMGGEEEEDHIYDEFPEILPCKVYKDEALDDATYPALMRDPPGTPSGVTEG